MKAPNLSDLIAHRLEALILDGGLKPGQRLPPERELAARFEVSRPSLREAIKKLEAKGVVETRRGGGSFVSSMMDQGLLEPLMGMFRDHPETLQDLVEMRQALEGLAAELAARRATEEDRRLLTRYFEGMNQAYREGKGVEEQAKYDARFHLAVAEAAHNAVLLFFMRGLFNLMESGIFTALEKLHTLAGANDLIHRHHETLYRAVLEGDAKGAREAALEHLAYVRDTLREIDEENRRIERSRLRLQALAADQD